MRAEKPLVAWYGDDMTGSIDVLEALAAAGVRGALVVGEPDAADAERFPWARAIGWAGATRGLPTEELRPVVGRAVEAMRDSGAPLLHYKV
ncbi:MAG TPA: four-carbon acid sugar kinase family protein, partial [Conexibacter sp.]|nr:four-carbon acid sugar kinase family protein [Conexibacter sp.]